MRFPLMITVAATALTLGFTTVMAQSGPSEFKTPPRAMGSDNARAEGDSHSGSQHREEPAASPRASDMVPGQRRRETTETTDRSDAVSGQERVEQGGSQDHQSASERARVHEQAVPERDRSSQQAHSEHEQPTQGAIEHDRQRADTQGNHEQRAGSGDRNPSRPMAAESQPGADQPRMEQSAQGQGTPRAASISASGPATEEQRTKIRQTILELAAKPPVTNANFSISVGTTVPERVTLYDLPPTIVEIVPEYRNYRYTVVRDEILIIDPMTRKVIDVIDQNEEPSSTGSISLTQEQQARIAHTLRDEAAATIRVGAPVPQCVQLRPVPQSVDVPALRSYQYFVVGRDVVLVDPDKRQVVQILH